MVRVVCILFSLLVFLAGCTSRLPSSSEDSGPVIPLPATFAGDITCNGCDRVEVRLNLRPDGLYQLRKTTYPLNGPVQVESQMNIWRFDEKVGLVVLGKGKGALKTYAVGSEGQLRYIGKEGEKEELMASYDLWRQGELDPFPDLVKLRGLFRMEQGKGVLTECSSGLRFPVITDAGGRQLEQVYRQSPTELSGSLLVSLNGTLVSLYGEEHLAVESVTRSYPGQTCEGMEQEIRLIDTTWRVTEITGNAIAATSEGPLPFVRLDRNENRLEGFSGCNRFGGTYLLRGDILVLTRAAAERVACPSGLSFEERFLKALDRVETYRLLGKNLTLIDKDEETVMRCIAAE